MWMIIFISTDLLINFYSPTIPENKKSIENNYLKNRVVRGYSYE